MGGFVTPADSGTLTNFVEIGQARDKILSLKLDQVGGAQLFHLPGSIYTFSRYPVQPLQREPPPQSTQKAILLPSIVL